MMQFAGLRRRRQLSNELSRNRVSHVCVPRLAPAARVLLQFSRPADCDIPSLYSLVNVQTLVLSRRRSYVRLM